MITIDAPISFILGTGIALATIDKGSESSLRNRAFTQGLIIQSCILSPVILFFMVRFPDWEWNYLFNAKEFFFSDDNISVGTLVLILIIASLNLTYIAGFKVSEHLLLNDNAKTVKLLLATLAGLVAAIMTVMYEQTLFVGTLEAFNKGEATLIFLSIDFLIAQTSAGILLGIGFFYIINDQKRHKGNT